MSTTQDDNEHTSVISNPDEADALFRESQEAAEAEQAELEDLDATRAELEEPAGPVPDDDAPATAAEATVETDGGDSNIVPMAEDCRVGSLALAVDGHGSIRFGKPSGRASMDILEPLESMEDDDVPMSELGDYVWGTLAEWAIDDEHSDPDFWANETGLLDGINTLRSVALGGEAGNMT